MRDFDAFLKALVANDHTLADEVRKVQETGRPPSSPAAAPSKSRRRALAPDPVSLRTIVLRVGRPVLAVVDDDAQLEFKDSQSEVWRARLQAAASRLQRAAQAVGRIDVTGHPQQLQYVGTGWLVDRDIILTNRHVAKEFSRRDGRRFTFAPRLLFGRMTASVDFLEEVGRSARRAFRIVDILHVEEDEGPDMAFVRVEQLSDKPLADPIPLRSSPAGSDEQVAVIGYPARDSRIADDALMHQIFGDVYDKKRLAPGQITGAKADVVTHDCSTLGGNSGSVVLDLTTGEAVGLHFAGRFLEANYAVPAAVVAQRLEMLRRPGVSPQAANSPAAPPQPPAAVASSGGGAVLASPPAPGSGAPVAPPTHEALIEGVAEDYADRRGYDDHFLDVPVPLPVIGNTADVLTFPWKGRTEQVLQYEHFSVVMSQSRRLCWFSAVNIDGMRPRKFKRPSWRLDPRIPIASQIRDECYGNEPKFARGHMTRREDPIWGENAEAARGNSDSMHVTNTVPQMQPFNAGIWLGLESYALEHAREDDMRISVFTGPFLRPDDPVRDGVLIPRSFWKVLAFIHDETAALCATAYTLSQEAFLRDEEFVFGQHDTAQVSIRSVEQKAGLSFGALWAVDPLDQDDEGTQGALTDPSQIVFRR